MSGIYLASSVLRLQQLCEGQSYQSSTYNMCFYDSNLNEDLDLDLN